MDTKDIWILFAGAALGYIGNLIATFTAPSVGNAFGKAKSQFIERRKANALLNYFQARDLKTGVRNKYFYAINSWGFILVYLSFSFASGIVGQLDKTSSLSSLYLLSSMCSALLAIRRTAKVVLMLDRVENFEQYEATLKKRWPDITSQSSASIVDDLKQPPSQEISRS
jgi:hypothetical protein